MMPEENDVPKDERLEQPPAFFPEEEFANAIFDDLEPVEVQIEGIYEMEVDRHPHRFIFLTDGEKRLPISIGFPEAKAILDPLEHETPDRPMTHDLLKTTIEKLGASVDRVVIDDLYRDISYAKVFLNMDGEEIVIDSRPSDAIALAVRFQVPIYVQSKVFASAHKE
ncbi:MAG: bifunctional nuclease family protein [Armatimonadota bacterium]